MADHEETYTGLSRRRVMKYAGIALAATAYPAKPLAPIRLPPLRRSHPSRPGPRNLKKLPRVPPALTRSVTSRLS
jgi:hypothetical protein